RAEAAYVFGRLLEEAAQTRPQTAPTTAPPPAPGKEPWAVFWEGTPPAVDLSLLEQLVQRNGNAFRFLQGGVNAFGFGDALKPADDTEVQALLGSLSRDIYRLPELKQQAAAALANRTLVHEYAGGLTILLNNLEEWDWPAEGVPLRPVW